MSLWESELIRHWHFRLWDLIPMPSAGFGRVLLPTYVERLHLLFYGYNIRLTGSLWLIEISVQFMSFAGSPSNDRVRAGLNQANHDIQRPGGFAGKSYSWKLHFDMDWRTILSAGVRYHRWILLPRLAEKLRNVRRARRKLPVLGNCLFLHYWTVGGCRKGCHQGCRWALLTDKVLSECEQYPK